MRNRRGKGEGRGGGGEVRMGQTASRVREKLGKRGESAARSEAHRNRDKQIHSYRSALMRRAERVNSHGAPKDLGVNTKRESRSTLKSASCSGPK